MESNTEPTESTNLGESVPEFTSNGDFVKIASADEIKTGNRKRICVDKRDVTVFCSKPNQMFAIDSVCYRNKIQFPHSQV
jgi:nitrite reductase/ring-hydroxylating ferredoxin subunit